MKAPLACSLTEADMHERRRIILDSVRAVAVDLTLLPLGYRIDDLRKTAAHVKVLSLEPLLGPPWRRNLHGID
jgi:protein gp37